MSNKRFTALVLAMIMVLVPISVSAKEIKGYNTDENITILNDDIYNLVYTEETEDGLYKIVEHMTKDFGIVESDFYKLNINTNEFEYVKHRTSKVSDGKILVEITENGNITHETYDITDSIVMI